MMRRAFVAASIVWAVALPLAPFATTRLHAATLWYVLALSADAVGSVICHQFPERSFHLWGVAMPVCARCTGIYIGAAIVALAAVAQPASTVRPKAQTTNHARNALLIAALPTLVTLVYEWITSDMPAGWIRAVAGAPIGAVVSAVVLGLVGATGDGGEAGPSRAGMGPHMVGKVN